MARPSYRDPPEAIDMAAAERAIRRASLAALAVSLVAFAAALVLLPAALELPADLPGRLAFAAQAALVPLAWLMAAVLLVSTGRRTSPADIGGAAAGPPSPRLAVRRAFLENTHEQAVLAAGAWLAWASLVGGAALAPIPAAAALFALGRALFLAGYARGVAGRAFGMALTLIPTLLLLLASAGVLLARLAGG